MKYSIIIPTIGRKTLFEVIEGIYECDDFYKINPEIIVVFDGKQKTTQNCHPELVSGSKAGDSLLDPDIYRDDISKNIKILETKQKVYAGGARNVGIEQSKGDILIFLGDNGIPEKDWLSRIVDFHKKFSEKNIVLLGKTQWKEKTDFTNFLENKAQFNYKTIIKSGATWRHFYTSNLSLKKEFLGSERFSDKFRGWGFEDSELGYRLEKKGMDLVFDENIKIFRTDNPTISDVIDKIQSSKNNAKIFELIHPEMKILPKGVKRIILYILIFVAYLFSPFFKKIEWWYLWKKKWVT